ncbi:MAG TPA: hypothetical protein DCX80_00385, partial [Chloroflexi bacterium]|nr:hypothetical protein [Chloroflexota bacterium]
MCAGCLAGFRGGRPTDERFIEWVRSARGRRAGRPSGSAAGPQAWGDARSERAGDCGTAGC